MINKFYLLIKSNIFKNTFFFIISGIVVQILSFLTLIYVSRTIDSESFGKIIFASTVVSYIVLLSNFGTSTYGAKIIARNHLNSALIINAVLIIRFSIALVLYILLFIFFFISDIEYKKIQLILLYSIEVIISIFLLDWIYHGKEKIYFIALSKLLAVLVTILLLLILNISENINYVPIAHIIGVFSGAFFLFLNFKKLNCEYYFSKNVFYLKNAFLQSLLIVNTNILNLLMFSSGILLLTYYSSDTVVGQYGILIKLIMLIVGFSGAYYSSIFPLSSSYYQSSINSLININSFSLRLSLFVAIPISFFIFSFPLEFTKFIFNETFHYSNIIFQLISLFLFVNLINTPLGRGLIVTDRQSSLLIIMIISALINLVFGFFLIPSLGLMGAIIALIIGEAVAFPLQFYKFFRFVKIEYLVFFKFIFFSIFLLFILNYVFEYFEIFWIINIFISLSIYLFIFRNFLKVNFR